MTKFQGNLLHGLRAYANLVEWFPLVSFCDSKPVSYVCYWWFGYLLPQKLVKSIDLLYPRIIYICLEKRYIPIFVSRYGCSNDLNKMTNFHCCHCLGGGDQVVLSSCFSIKLWQVNIHCLTKHKLNTWNTSLLLNFWGKQTF